MMPRTAPLSAFVVSTSFFAIVSLRSKCFREVLLLLDLELSDDITKNVDLFHFSMNQNKISTK